MKKVVIKIYLTPARYMGGNILQHLIENAYFSAMSMVDKIHGY